MLVQAFIAQTTVERLNQAILHRLAGLDVAPCASAIVLPFQDGVRGQLRPVVADYHAGKAFDRSHKTTSLGPAESCRHLSGKKSFKPTLSRYLMNSLTVALSNLLTEKTDLISFLERPCAACESI